MALPTHPVVQVRNQTHFRFLSSTLNIYQFHLLNIYQSYLLNFSHLPTSSIITVALSSVLNGGSYNTPPPINPTQVDCHSSDKL